MKKQQFNPEEYVKLKHRVEALRSRVKLDSGPEQETAIRLLAKVEKRLKEYEKTHEIPAQDPEDYSTTINFDFDNFYWDSADRKSYQGDQSYHEDTRSEEEIINDLGILYAIFGSTYQTVLNYHVYKIRFKRQATKDGAFYRVYSDIYEDNNRICQDIIIGFWPYHFGDDRCGDMEFASMSNRSTKKYDNGCSVLYITLIEGLKDIWNFYFDNLNAVPKLTGPILGYNRYESHSSTNTKLEEQLSQEQREKVIFKVENEIDSGKMKHLEPKACRYVIMAYRPYNSLIEFLKEAGVVYRVDWYGVYIWNHHIRDYGKLVGYEYNSSTCSYCLYLV